MSIRIRVRFGVVVTAGLCGSLLLASCSASADQPAKSPTPTGKAARQVVTVVTDPDKCVSDPAIVNAGDVVIKATAVGDEAIQVTLYGPKDGQFSLVYGSIPRLLPGTTKSMKVKLEQGAYEIACADDRDDERSRLTAI
ncbi:MAG: hypothetical protein ACOYD0_01845 [Candidatus Nanopelagicales bacterium]